MADTDREDLLYKFFDKSKRKYINGFAKQLVKDNYSVEKYMGNLGKTFSDLEIEKKRKHPDACNKAMGN